MNNTIVETLDLIEVMKKYADRMDSSVEEEQHIADKLINLSVDIFMNMLDSNFD